MIEKESKIFTITREKSREQEKTLDRQEMSMAYNCNIGMPVLE